MDEDSILAELLRDHQQLLLSAGLAVAVEEAQHRMAAAGERALVDALRVVGGGLDAAVRSLQTTTAVGPESDWEARGLNAIDKFYSDVCNSRYARNYTHTHIMIMLMIPC